MLKTESAMHSELLGKVMKAVQETAAGQGGLTETMRLESKGGCSGLRNMPVLPKPKQLCGISRTAKSRL